jgi:hypothetical protein
MGCGAPSVQIVPQTCKYVLWATKRGSHSVTRVDDCRRMAACSSCVYCGEHCRCWLVVAEHDKNRDDDDKDEMEDEGTILRSPSSGAPRHTYSGETPRVHAWLSPRRATQANRRTFVVSPGVLGLFLPGSAPLSPF